MGADIARRLLLFGVETLRLAALLPRDAIARHVSGQWVRAATSAGANYEEARAAESRADFIHKLGIATKEVREACYWIDLANASGLLTARASALREDGRQLCAILAASVRTAKQRI